MSSTPPKRSVQWGQNDILNTFGSPYSDTNSSETASPSSTLQYLNSQLVAHGYASPPGISIVGLSNDDGEKLVKCLMSLLGQRIDDLTRSEDLSTKLRTLTYEHERISSMYRSTQEQVSKVEQAKSSLLSQLNSLDKTLKASETSHKSTSLELSRTRSALQAVRQSHSSEGKRKEKETERMIEKWIKISEAQVKLSQTSAGLTFNTTRASPRRESDGRGKDLLEQALEDAEQARKDLIEENAGLRAVMLSVVNELSRILSLSQSGHSAGESEFYTLEDLFSLSPLGTSNDIFTAILARLKESVSRYSDESPYASSEHERSERNAENYQDKREIKRLQNTVRELQEQLDRKKEAHTVMKDSDSDDALWPTVTIRPDRAQVPATEVEANTHSYNLGFSPSLDLSSPEESVQRKLKGRSNSPRKSMRIATNKRSSFAVGAVSSPGRKNRKSILKKTTGVSLSVSTVTKVIPPMETEVIPTSISNGLIPSTSQSTIIPTPFALPPPSPLAMIPRRDKPISLTSGREVRNLTSVVIDSGSPNEPMSCFESNDSEQPQDFPATPRPFPIAKPFAQRMIHAYSPARPSPLSRVLLMAESRSESRADPSKVNSVANEINETIEFLPTNVDPMGFDYDDDEKDDSPLRDKVTKPLVVKKSRIQKDKVSKALVGKQKKKVSSKASIREATDAKGKENSGTASGPALTEEDLEPRGRTQSAKTAFKAPVALSKPFASGKGGARRVPIGSAEAAPIGPGWK